MKRVLFITLTLVAFFALAVFMACDKKEQVFDVKGDPTLKIFFNEKGASTNDLTRDLKIKSGDLLKKIKIAWPARRTAAEDNACKVTTGIDNSLIEAYNAKNKTEYKAFPEAALILENSVTIGAGQSISADSVSLSLDTSKASLLTDKLYLAPIKIISVTSGAVSSNFNTVYVRLSIK